jgi:hypothetical protein
MSLLMNLFYKCHLKVSRKLEGRNTVVTTQKLFLYAGWSNEDTLKAKYMVKAHHQHSKNNNNNLIVNKSFRTLLPDCHFNIKC